MAGIADGVAINAPMLLARMYALLPSSTLPEHSVEEQVEDGSALLQVQPWPPEPSVPAAIQRAPVRFDRPGWGQSPGAVDQSHVVVDTIAQIFRRGVSGGSTFIGQADYGSNQLRHRRFVWANSSGTIEIRVRIHYSLDGNPLLPGGFLPSTGDIENLYVAEYSCDADGTVSRLVGNERPGPNTGTGEVHVDTYEGSAHPHPEAPPYLEVQVGIRGPARQGMSMGGGGQGQGGGGVSLNLPSRSGGNDLIPLRYTLELAPQGARRPPGPPTPVPVNKEPKVFNGAFYVRFPFGLSSVPARLGQSEALDQWWNTEVPAWVRDGPTDTLQITVWGHASAPGTYDDNQRLARDRARWVIDNYLGFVDRERAHVRHDSERGAPTSGSPRERDDEHERYAVIRVRARQSGSQPAGTSTAGTQTERQ